MGYLCTTGDQVALRHYRQKRFARLQPLFTDKYTSLYDPYLYWYSQNADFNNGNGLFSPLFGGSGFANSSNFSIVAPDSEVFHIQGGGFPESTEYAYYISDYSTGNIVGETTLVRGVRLFFSGSSSVYLRDKPWLKYGVLWYCTATLQTQQSTWTGEYSQSGETPIYTEWSTIATTSNTFFNTLSQTSFASRYASNSLYVPKGSETMGEGQNSGIAVVRTRFLGSLSLYGHTIYRIGDYHHA